MKITIRRALPEDACEYASCHISSWRSAYKGIVPDDYLGRLSAERRAEKLRQNLEESGDYSYYCAVYEDKIIGIFIIGKSRDRDMPDAGEVSAIYLTEEFWGRGFGREMMNYATDALKCMGFSRVIVWVLEDNARARKFYEKCNFAFDGTKKEIEIGKPLIEIRYVLDL